MGSRSSIDRLDSGLRKQLVTLLEDPNITQQEIAEIINSSAGANVVSKSSVNRYALKMRKFSERNRQAREVAEMYLSKYGEERQNKLGKVINEQVRMVAFDLMLNLEEIKEGDNDPETLADIASVINKVARGIKDLEQAAHVNAERERKLQEDLARKADEVEETVKLEGLSQDGIEKIKRTILGL